MNDKNDKTICSEVSYTTKEHAQFQIDNYLQSYADHKLNVYKCKKCNNFHIK